MIRFGTKRGWYLRDHFSDGEYFLSRWKWVASVIQADFLRRNATLNHHPRTELVFLERADG